MRCPIFCVLVCSLAAVAGSGPVPAQQVLWEVLGTGTGYGLVGSLRDLDMDGVEDILAGHVAAAANTGFLQVLSGSDGTVVYELWGAAPGSFLQTQGIFGDLDGDDFPDVVVGKSFAPGRVQAYSLAPTGVATYGAACPLPSGALPRIGATGSPALGTTFAVNLSSVPPWSYAGLLMGFSATQSGANALPLDLAPLGLPGCSLLVSFDVFLPTQALETSPGIGAASLAFGVPNDPALAGATVFAQWAVANPPSSPAIASLTRGLAITLQ